MSQRLLVFCVICAAACDVLAQDEKPVPRLAVLPQPHDQAAFMREDTEIARYHFAPWQRRPFVYPVVGPSGRSLTRMGHPRDAQGHSHHNSVWISHHSVNGVSFWGDSGKGKIVHQRIEQFEDLGEQSWITTTNAWVDETSGKTTMTERRRTSAMLLEANQFMLIIDMQLEAPKDAPVTLGKTPFGIIGVRMAKTIGVNDGGGEIRNSEGASGEKDIFWKPAKWVDYSGPIRTGVIEGITLMDHPANPNHPSVFHVRSDGWMGASLTHEAERVIDAGKSLRLRYGLHVHAGKPGLEELKKRFEAFAKVELPLLEVKKQ